MKISITADLHLTSRAEHPNRFAALEDVLDQTLDCGARTVVVAGDLFDEHRRDFHEFEEVIGRQEYRSMQVVIIPGNHDAVLRQNMFSLTNIRIIEQPELVWLADEGLPFLFLPYKPGVSAGDQLAVCAAEIHSHHFVLISHGDYISGPRTPNPLEPGIYMPLTRLDLEKYHPERVFLGHTHVPFECDSVVSPGSPSAVDHSELGRRSFWIYDSLINTNERKVVQSGPIFMREKFSVNPSMESIQSLRADIHNRLNSWGFSDSEIRRVLLQAVFTGCSPDRSALRVEILRELNGITLYPAGEPDLSGVLAEDDPALAAAAGLALESISELSLTPGRGIPELDEIQREVFRLVYRA